MEPARAAYWTVVVGVFAIVALTGQVGGLNVTAESPGLGEGNATVVEVGVVEEPAITDGRFGTERVYARAPTVAVTVRNVTGTPRVLLRSEIPRLEFDDATWRVLEAGTRGTFRLSLADRPFPAEEIRFGETTVRTTVRVQSFDGGRVAYAKNHSVEVAG
jgi:hypothetical protein